MLNSVNKMDMRTPRDLALGRMVAMNSAELVWKKTLLVLGDTMTEVAIKTWFADIVPVTIQDGTLILCVAEEYTREIINANYKEKVEDALRQLFSMDYPVKFVSEEEAKRYREGQVNKSAFLPGAEDFTFDRFVVGPSNRFAYNAAKKVSEAPGYIYNPLFIYGASGLGKTHLLYAIAHAVHEQHPEWKILYVKSETFVNELVENLRSQERYMENFRKKYRDVDVFLMDDVQFIAGKNYSEEELFHTFNTLFEQKKQIVFTSDRPPEEMLRLEERLRTRFSCGLPVDIQPPDYETRVAIIKNKAVAKGVDLPEPVLQYVAENITANVRQIEGTVSKIVAMHELMGQQINVDNVIRAVRDMLSAKNEFLPSPDLIIAEVSQFYEIDAASIKGQGQSKTTAAARNVAMYLIRNMTELSLQEIGAIFNGRHHTTVINSIKRVENLIHNDPNMGEIIQDLKSTINSKFE